MTRCMTSKLLCRQEGWLSPTERASVSAISLRVFPLEFRKKDWSSENHNHGATRRWRQFDDRLSRFDTIPACDGQTDRRPAYINNVRSILTHVENWFSKCWTCVKWKSAISYFFLIDFGVRQSCSPVSATVCCMILLATYQLVNAVSYYYMPMIF